MARNDSILYTGHTGNRLEENKLKKEERQRVKARKRNELLPVAEVVIEELDKELDKTQIELLQAINHKTTKLEIKDTIVALNLYTESLKKLKSKFNLILRTHEKTEA